MREKVVLITGVNSGVGLTPWLNRFIILGVAVLFVLISLKFVLDPPRRLG